MLKPYGNPARNSNSGNYGCMGCHMPHLRSMAQFLFASIADFEFKVLWLQVLLPTAPDAHIPDSFFERTGRDLKAEWQRVKKQREQDETLMTKAHREKLRMAGRKVHKYATIRVRFPEGIILQGML